MSAVLTHEYEPHGELVPTMAEQRRREERAAEIMEERWGNLERFCDVVDGIDADAINIPLHRALMHLDRACYGHEKDIEAVLRAISEIQRTVKLEAQSLWSDECETLAAMEAV